MQRTKAYLRRQRAGMISIATHSRRYWAKEEKRWMEISKRFAAVFNGVNAVMEATEVLKLFQNYADEARNERRRCDGLIRKWRRKKI